MTSRTDSPGRAGLLALLATLLVAPGCDNPACVFGPGNCQDSGTTDALGKKAALPVDGSWIDDGAPVLESFRPSGDNVHSRTPIALRFSESMSAASLVQAIEVVSLEAFGVLPVVATQALIADGRVLVLLPQNPLTAGTLYEIRYNDTPVPGGVLGGGGGGTVEPVEITDLTGQVLIQPDDFVIGQFTVAPTDPEEPSVIMTWPPDDAVGMSDIGEIAVVFDRPMDASTFDAQSWVVEVNGAAPAFDPAPTPISLAGGIFALPDTRAWRYRSLDGDGLPAPFGPSAAVELSLSPVGAELLDGEDQALPATIVDYETAAFSAPTGASIESEPPDAIGIANLTTGDPEELVIRADLLGAEAGDEVALFVFGPSLGEEPELVALKREVFLEGAGPFAEATFSLADVDLVKTASPLQAELSDGTLAMALRLSRGVTLSPVRLLDVDADLKGPQGPVLDTTAPELTELHVPGGEDVTEFRSDLRDLVVAGLASEPIRGAFVSTPLGDNGGPLGGIPAVLGATDDGHFLAAPVPLGIVGAADLPLAFDLTVYDSALNASAIFSGQYAQRGQVTGPAPLGGSALEVDVVDARTLAPIEGALVFAHADDGAGTALVDVQTTSPSGTATLTSAAGFATILTVDARDIGTGLIDYDLFTFHGVSASRLSVPLTRSVGQLGTASGDVSTASSFAALTLPLVERGVGDTRRAAFGLPTYGGGPCGTGSLPAGALLSCAFGPEPVEVGRTGAISYLAGNFHLSGATFSPLAALQVFELNLPRPPVATGSDDEAAFEIPALLSEPGVDPALVPREYLADGVTVPPAVIADVGFTEAPLVALESHVPGIRGAAVVGLGIAVNPTPLPPYTQWSTRSAYAGTAGIGGPLALAGTLDGDPMIRGELRNAAGNVSIHRRRRSLLADFAPIPNFLVPPSPSDLAAPAGTSGPLPYDLVVENTLADAYGAGGLYRVTLTDAAGRRWVAVALDPPDAAGATVRVRLPDLAAGGGQGLADGTIQALVEGAAWEAFDPTGFVWSDFEREFGVYARAAAVTYQQP